MDWIRQMQALSRQCRQSRRPSQDCRQCQAKVHGRLLELSVPTERCPHDRAGHCLMCNYGIGQQVTDLRTFSAQIRELLCRYRPETLLLSTNGSILDDSCLPPAAQELLLAEAAASPARTVILETHPETLREEKLADDDGKPTVVMVHQFTVNAGLNFFDIKTRQPWCDKFNEIISRHRDTVKLVACGHVHNGIHGTIAGVPIVASFSANWEAYYDFRPVEEMQDFKRQAGYYIHRFDGESIVSYAVTAGNAEPS